MSFSSFKPAWWLANSHLQTLWPKFCRRAVKNFSYSRERVELSDGDFVDLACSGEGNGPIVLVLHGFEGSLDSHYVKGMLQRINRCGWRSVFMHFRGCSEESNRLPRSYHSGETQDLSEVVAWLQTREPHTPLAAIGFSLGGNVLLKWLGETKDCNPLTAAMAISVPFELNKSVERMEKGFSRIYERHLVKCVCQRLLKKFQQQAAPFDISCLSTMYSLREFDEKITAPMHGFASADDYYAKSSSRSFLQYIRVPTLLVQAHDDPLMTKNTIPTQAELPPCVELEVTSGGGHVGFVAGRVPWRVEYWLEKRAEGFLKKVFGTVVEKNSLENV